MRSGMQRDWDTSHFQSQSRSSETYLSSMGSSRNSSNPTDFAQAPDAGMLFQEKIRLLKQTMEQQRLQRQREFNEQQQKKQQQQELLRRQTEIYSPSSFSQAGSRSSYGPIAASQTVALSPPASRRLALDDTVAENSINCSRHNSESSPDLLVVEASPAEKEISTPPSRCNASTMTDSALDGAADKVPNKTTEVNEPRSRRAEDTSSAVVSFRSARQASPAAMEMCEEGARRAPSSRRPISKQPKGIRTLRAPSESSASVCSAHSMPRPAHSRAASPDAAVHRAAGPFAFAPRPFDRLPSPPSPRPSERPRAAAATRGGEAAERQRRCLHRQMRLVDAAMARAEQTSWANSLRTNRTPRAAAAAERQRLAALRRQYEVELMRVGESGEVEKRAGKSPLVRARSGGRGNERNGSQSASEAEISESWRRPPRYGPTAYESVLKSQEQRRTRRPSVRKINAPRGAPNTMSSALRVESNAIGSGPRTVSNTIGGASRAESHSTGRGLRTVSKTIGGAPRAESHAIGRGSRALSSAKGRASRAGSIKHTKAHRSLSLDAEQMAALYARHTSERRDAPFYWRVGNTNPCADVPAEQYYCAEFEEDNVDSEKDRVTPSRARVSSSTRKLCYSLRAPSRGGETERNSQAALSFRIAASPRYSVPQPLPERSLCREDGVTQPTPRKLSPQFSDVRVSPLTDGSADNASPITPSRMQGPLSMQGSSAVQGPLAMQGSSVVQGPLAIQGSSGEQGPTGMQWSSAAQGPLTVQWPSAVQGPLSMQGTSVVQGPLSMQGASAMQGLLAVQGTSAMQGPLSIQGASAMQGPLSMQGASAVQGPLSMQGASAVQGPLAIRESSGEQGPTGMQWSSAAQGPLTVQWPSAVQGPLSMQGTSVVQGPLSTQGASVMQGPLAMQGTSVVQGPLSMQGTSVVQGPLSMQGTSVVQGPLSMQGTSVVQGPLSMQGTSVVQGPLSMQGASAMQGLLAMQGTSAMQGPLSMQGSSAVQGPLSMQGASAVQGPLSMQGASAVQGPLAIRESSGEQGPTGMQWSSAAQGPLTVQWPSAVQGPPVMQGMVRVVGSDRTNEMRGVWDSCGSAEQTQRPVDSSGVSLRQLLGHNGTSAALLSTEPKASSSTEVLIERIQRLRKLMK